MFELGVDSLIPWLVLAVVGAAFWYALRPKWVFTVRIENGAVASTAGQVTRSFVHDVEEVCQRASVSVGEIRGQSRGRSIVLAFYGAIPGECQQQLRNLWQVHGTLR